MKRIKNTVEEYFNLPLSEILKVGASTLGVFFGMAASYYFLDRIFG